MVMDGKNTTNNYENQSERRHPTQETGHAWKGGNQEWWIEGEWGWKENERGNDPPAPPTRPPMVPAPLVASGPDRNKENRGPRPEQAVLEY